MKIICLMKSVCARAHMCVSGSISDPPKRTIIIIFSKTTNLTSFRLFESSSRLQNYGE